MLWYSQHTCTKCCRVQSARVKSITTRVHSITVGGRLHEHGSVISSFHLPVSEVLIRGLYDNFVFCISYCPSEVPHRVGAIEGLQLVFLYCKIITKTQSYLELCLHVHYHSTTCATYNTHVFPTSPCYIMSLKGYTCAWVKVEFLITTINWIGDINMFLWKKKKEKKKRVWIIFND